jgi:alpha-beta hydrolase superfamily lysophospholipase
MSKIKGKNIQFNSVRTYLEQLYFAINIFLYKFGVFVLILIYFFAVVVHLDKMVVWGHSMGTAIATILGKQKRKFT